MTDRPERGNMTWHQVDEAVNWLVATLGDDLRQQIDAAAEVFGAMKDDERHRHRARHTELSLALASLRRRDRGESMGSLPTEERRAITLALFSRLCDSQKVSGWHPRVQRVLTSDDTLYRSIHFEFECAALLAKDGLNQVEFLPEDTSLPTAEMRVGDLVEIECKRLQGRSMLDRKTTDRWRRLQNALANLMEVGNEYVFAVDIKDAPLESDIKAITHQARKLLKSSGDVNVSLTNERVKFVIKRTPLQVSDEGLHATLLPAKVLNRYHVQHVEMSAQFDGRKMAEGIAAVLAFRTDQEPDILKRARKTLKKSRRQLPKDHPSITIIDTYEPLHDFHQDDREVQRKLIYSALQDELVKHDRPTGVMLVAPEPPEESPVMRSFVYAGNQNPSAPFPTEFELFPGWTPATSETLREDDRDE